mgnify:CR=1 FL=1
MTFWEYNVLRPARDFSGNNFYKKEVSKWTTEIVKAPMAVVRIMMFRYVGLLTD